MFIYFYVVMNLNGHELKYVKRRKGQKDGTILPESNQHIYYSEPKQNTHTGQ